jgi:hypothetical protein
MEAEGGLCFRLRDVQRRLKDMEEQVRDIIASSGWPPSHLLLEHRQRQEASDVSLSRCRECNGSFGSKWLRTGCCWWCRSALRNSGRCSSSNSPLCMVCPHLRACFACDGVSCSVCGVVRSVAVESDGSLSDWLLELDPQPRTLFLDFDATLCNTASGGAPQISRHALHVELAAIVESGAFCIVILTKQNPQHRPHIVKFLEAVGWEEGREYLLHCIGGTGVGKSSVIQAIMDEQCLQFSAPSYAVFIDDSIKEILQARSQLPPSVTMLVFAAAKSLYARTSHRAAAASGFSTHLLPAVNAVHVDLNADSSSRFSPSAQAAATKLEEVLGVKVDMSQPVDSGVLPVQTSAISLAPLSSTTASVIVKHGPGWSVESSSHSSIAASTTLSVTSLPESCTGDTF